MVVSINVMQTLNRHGYFYSGDGATSFYGRNYSSDYGDSYDVHIGGKWLHHPSKCVGEGLESLARHLHTNTPQ